jgi:hypothetical protein
VGTACSEEEEHELADLRSKICCLRSEAPSLHAECDRAHGDMDHLRNEGSRLGETLRGVKSCVGWLNHLCGRRRFTWCKRAWSS